MSVSQTPQHFRRKPPAMVALPASLGCLHMGDTESLDKDSDMVGGTGKGTRRENAHCVSVVFPSPNYDISIQLSVL